MFPNYLDDENISFMFKYAKLDQELDEVQAMKKEELKKTSVIDKHTSKKKNKNDKRKFIIDLSSSATVQKNQKQITDAV